MGTEHRDGAGRNVLQLIDKHGASLAQIVDHVLVVNNFMKHIHGSAIAFKGELHNLDGARHPGTESSGLREKNVHG